MDKKTLSDLIFPNAKDISYYEEKYKKRELNDGAMVLRMGPSPTGMFHLGNLYMSFFNRQLANQTNGVFYARIEDTDQKREVEGATDVIFEGFEDFGIKIDESIKHGGEYGPYIQSERKEIYDAYIKWLIVKDLAYPCFCTEEKLEENKRYQEDKKERLGYYGRWSHCRLLTTEEQIKKVKDGVPYIIRLKSQGDFEEKHFFKDEIKGEVAYYENDIDIVLMKSDGLPTYHLAHTVDDHLMQTTHVMRDDTWLSSLPVHLELFQLLDFKTPKYAHVAPLTKNDNGSVRKLSKRKDPEFAVSFYHEMGIPNEALKLYFATIGNTNFEEWYLENNDKSYNDFTFTFNKMTTGGTQFDIEKLMSVSKIYFSKLKAENIYEDTLKYSKKYDTEFQLLLEKHKEYTINLLNIERNTERPRMDIASYPDVKDEFWYMYDELFFEEKEQYKDISYNYDITFIKEYIENIYSDDDNEEEWFNKVKEFASKKGFAVNRKEYKANPENFLGNIADFCGIIRSMITTTNTSPNMYDLIKLLGRKRLSKRVELFISSVN